ncbi:MAG: DUF1854 domain-containing protein [Thermofilaceae archaeon]|nr:DUF1854 domain-containing protein [Thermofilaceae archaeon]MCX8180170.1 DUF1854 domain-containing protein [Thermofilaceae archaeon]MDW8004174.1 DUF1854 domain-containing protein [Thermofilaceae archaeon]
MLHKFSELKILEPSRVRVSEARLDEIDVEIDGELIRGVRPRRPFPFSYPEIVILYKDKEELGILRDYRNLDTRSRELLEKVLKVVYFMPKIRRVLNIRSVEGKYEWKVITDKGELTFFTWGRCVRVLRDGRLLVRDIYSRAYIVDEPEKLDNRSRLYLSMMI